jgi:hypothetical protein
MRAPVSRLQGNSGCGSSRRGSAAGCFCTIYGGESRELFACQRAGGAGGAQKKLPSFDKRFDYTHFSLLLFG